MYFSQEDNPSLELEALFLNINPGYNEKLKSICKSLSDYAEYTSRVRRDAKAEGFAEGKSEGKSEGRNELLEELVKKKLQKNKSPEIIAEELEEDISVIQNIITKLTQ